MIPQNTVRVSTSFRHITMTLRRGGGPAFRRAPYSRSRVGSQMLGRMMLFMRNEEMGMQMM